MRNQGRIVIGIAIIVMGLVIAAANLLNIDMGMLCWPTVLILLGLGILLRAWLVDADTSMDVRLFGPIRRKGVWQVQDQEYWLLVGDIDLDLSQAQVPAGETTLRCFGIVGTTRLLVPEGVGVRLSSTAIITDAKMMGKKRESFFVPVHATSEDYEVMERKIHLEVLFVIADVRIQRDLPIT